jgi:hypothetical protein
LGLEGPLGGPFLFGIFVGLVLIVMRGADLILLGEPVSAVVLLRVIPAEAAPWLVIPAHAGIQ